MVRTKTQKILRYSLYGLAGAAVLGVVSYAFVIRPLQINNQKKNFDKAEASLDTLAEQIQQTIGKADETKKEKSCGYASQEFGRGSRSCGVSLNLLFRSRPIEEVNKIMSRVASSVGGELYYFLGSKDLDGKPYPQNFTTSNARTDDRFSQNLSAPDNLNCSIEYIYPVTKLENKDTFKDLVGENMGIYLSCGGPTLKEFYPLKD